MFSLSTDLPGCQYRNARGAFFIAVPEFGGIFPNMGIFNTHEPLRVDDCNDATFCKQAVFYPTAFRALRRGGIMPENIQQSPNSTSLAEPMPDFSRICWAMGICPFALTRSS